MEEGAADLQLQTMDRGCIDDPLRAGPGDGECLVRRLGQRLYVDADLGAMEARLFTGLVPSPRNTGVYVSTVVQGFLGETAIVRLRLHGGSVVSETSKVSFVKDVNIEIETDIGLGLLFQNISGRHWRLLCEEMEHYSADLLETTDERAVPLPALRQAPPLPEGCAFQSERPRPGHWPAAPEKRCETVVAEVFHGARRDPRFEFGFAAPCRSRIFVATSHPRPVQARVDLWLVDAETRSGLSRLRGTVRWVRTEHGGIADPRHLPGMGVELDPLSGVEGWDGCLVCAEYS